MANATETAWAAGLFEGEGSIEIGDLATAKRTFVRLRLNMTDGDVVEKFARVVGCGTVRLIRAPSVLRPHWKRQWGWAAGRGDDCARLLESWLPHFGTRRAARAREALVVLAAKEEDRHRTCYCGKPFYAERGNRAYCSSECRRKWAWQRERAAA